MKDTINEEWRFIPGLNGKYMVSNTGKVKSVKRELCSRGKTMTIQRDKLISPYDCGDGYLRFNAWMPDHKRKCVLIHRAVALAFIENPDGKPCINHIDNDRGNNNVENLEWCTHQENEDWKTKQDRRPHKSIKGVNQTTGETVHYHKLIDASADGFSTCYIRACCHKQQKKYKGYEWEFENEH